MTPTESLVETCPHTEVMGETKAQTARAGSAHRPAPRVSVVIPAFNSAPYIATTVDSILEQTYQDFELVISDHASTDKTWSVLQTYAAHPKVRLMRIAPGGGAVANWRAVTAEARGELVKLVCGDDLLYPECLARQVAALDAAAGDAVMVVSQRDIIDDDGRPAIRGRGLQGIDVAVPGRVAVRRTIRAGTNIFGEPMCVLFRRAALEDAGGWDPRSPYLIDQATCAQVALRGMVVPVKEPLAAFRVSHQQWSVALARQQSRHARAFHHRIAAERPGVVSRRDVFVGDVRATAMAWGRRLAYLWLRRRMGGGQRA